MAESRVYMQYSIHRVQHTLRTAFTTYCIIPRLTVSRCQPVSEALHGPCYTQFSTFPWLGVCHWIECQLPSHLPADLPCPDQPAPSTPPISIEYGLLVHLQTLLITASKCISDFPDLGLQVHLQIRSITASKCISEVVARGLPLLLQTRSITASKCITEFHFTMAFKCITELLEVGLHMHLQTRLIMASKCISKLAWSWPRSASLSSTWARLQVHLWVTRSRPPNASPNVLNLGLQLHLQTRSITASKCISEFHDLGLQVHLQTPSITASKCISELHDLGL